MTGQVTTIQELNTNIATLAKNLQEAKGIRFSEPAQETQNGFAFDMGGIFRVNAGSGLVIALGIALSSMVTGFFSKFLPFGSGGIAKLIVGIVLKKFIAKSGAFAEFATGIVLAGIAELAQGLTGGLSGMFSEKYNPNKASSLVSYSEPAGYPAMSPVAWR